MRGPPSAVQPFSRHFITQLFLPLLPNSEPHVHLLIQVKFCMPADATFAAGSPGAYARLPTGGWTLQHRLLVLTPPDSLRTTTPLSAIVGGLPPWTAAVYG